jgi:hypothetical protein
MVLAENFFDSVGELISDYNAGQFIPIKESDIAAHLYHLWVHNFGSKYIHLETRLCDNIGPFYDLVIGKVDRTKDKPCIVDPALVAEIKVFVHGFTNKQLYRRYNEVLKDIEKLEQLQTPPDTRYILIFDETQYLKKTKRDIKILQYRDTIDQKIQIIHVDLDVILKHSLL